MSTQAQSDYIAGLTVRKTKEFKEVKELLVSNQIVSADADTVKNAATIADITNALTDQQASKFIDVLVAAKEPARSPVYAQARVSRTIDNLASIKDTVSGWSFN